MRPFPLEAFGELSSRLIWLGLIHSVWIGLLVAAGVALVFQVGARLSHRARHAILLFAMVGVVVGPVALALLLHVIPSLPTTIVSPRSEPTLVVITGQAASRAAIPGRATDEHRSDEHSGRTRLAKVLAWSIDQLCRSREVVIGTWLPPTACLGAFLVLGAWRVRRFCRESDAASGPIQARAGRLARRLGLKKIPRILVHPGLAEPFLCGGFRTVIVLPGPWLTTASSERLDAILAHELAHARRLDHLVNLAQRLVEVMLFFHPAVHWLSRSLRSERELCTDALAVRLTRDPLALAEALQSVARLRLHFRSPMGRLLSGTSLGGQTVSLLPRIQELIGMTPSRPQRHVWPFAALPAAGMIALIATAAGLARDDPSISSAGLKVRTPVSATRADSGRKPVTEPMIRYEVRFCWLPAAPWRELLLDRLKPVKLEADVAAWIMDDKALLDFLTSAQQDTKCNVLQAPKCSAIEGAHVIIFSRRELHYVADVEHTGKVWRPIIKNLDIGLKCDLTGTFLPRGTRLSVDVSNSSVLGFHTLFRKARIDGEVRAAQYQVPSVLNRRAQVSCDLPEGSCLVISTGLSDEHKEPAGIAGFASDALESVGLPKFEGKSITYEQLVIVNTQPIEPDAQKPVVVARPASKSQDQGRDSR